MLLNLSNHPSAQWTEAQKQAAIEQFGEIKDISFPAVDPAGDDEYIYQLAKEYSFMCAQEYENSLFGKFPFAVHIMGEMTFCFSLISFLSNKGIRCIASTTARVVSFEGTKRISEFKFVRFRDYPEIIP